MAISSSFEAVWLIAVIVPNFGGIATLYKAGNFRPAGRKSVSMREETRQFYPCPESIADFLPPLSRFPLVFPRRNDFKSSILDCQQKPSIGVKSQEVLMVSGLFLVLVAALFSTATVPPARSQEPGGYVLIFREFVHCYQWESCELRLKDKMELYRTAMEQKDFMWELKHAFPCGADDFRQTYQAMIAALAKGDSARLPAIRSELKKRLAPEDWE